MTPKQRACLAAIERLTERGVSPSYRELRDELGLKSLSGVHRLVHGLLERGVISVRPGLKRTIRIVDREAETVPFTALADAAVHHAQRHGGSVSTDTMRAELIRAFRAYRIQFPEAA